jgi:hypothetical protein
MGRLIVLPQGQGDTDLKFRLVEKFPAKIKVSRQEVGKMGFSVVAQGRFIVGFRRRGFVLAFGKDRQG